MKKLMKQIILVLLGITSLYITIIIISYLYINKPEQSFENREIFKVVEKFPSLLENLNRKDNKEEAYFLPMFNKYTGECEKEITNKYSTNVKSVECTRIFLKSLDKAEIYEDVYKDRDTLLKCFNETDKNIYEAYTYNIEGVDKAVFELYKYPLMCKSNKEHLLLKMKDFLLLLFIVPLALIAIALLFSEFLIPLVFGF